MLTEKLLIITKMNPGEETNGRNRETHFGPHRRCHLFRIAEEIALGRFQSNCANQAIKNTLKYEKLDLTQLFTFKNCVVAVSDQGKFFYHFKSGFFYKIIHYLNAVHFAITVCNSCKINGGAR